MSRLTGVRVLVGRGGGLPDNHAQWLLNEFERVTAVAAQLRGFVEDAQEAMPPATQLDMLAKWIDVKYAGKDDDDEVQRDLRRWAVNIRRVATAYTDWLLQDGYRNEAESLKIRHGDGGYFTRAEVENLEATLNNPCGIETKVPAPLWARMVMPLLDWDCNHNYTRWVQSWHGRLHTRYDL